MSMQHSIEGLRATGAPTDAVRADVIEGILRGRGVDISFSSVATPVEVSALQTPQHVSEIPEVIEDHNIRVREALEREGFTVVINPEFFDKDEVYARMEQLFRGRLDSFSEEMRLTLPQFEFAINPTNVRIEDSRNKSTEIQLGMISEYETVLRSKLPEDVRGFIDMIMPKYPSILAMLDIEHEKRTGERLFTDWIGAIDGIGGRAAPSGELKLRDFPVGPVRFDIPRPVFAIPVVVFSRKLVV